MKASWKRNLKVWQCAARSGATVLCALKAFSMWELAPLVSRYLSGVCASGLWEARLGREEYGGLVETYSAGYKPSEMPENRGPVRSYHFQYDRRQGPLFAGVASVGARDFMWACASTPGLPFGDDPKYDPAAPRLAAWHAVGAD